MRLFVFVVVLLLVVQTCFGAYCHGKPSKTAAPNTNPINMVAPRLINSTKNGKLFIAGGSNNEFLVAHVWGTPYEMGYAQGVMMKKQLMGMLPGIWKYLEEQVEEVMKKVPEFIAKIIADEGLDVALDLTYDWTVKYTGAYIYEEMKGIADASGVDYKMIRRIHQLPGLTKGSCSMFGAWGSAVKNSNTDLLQLRALDWIVDGPFQDYPAVVVYHPNEGNGHPFANVGFSGFIGSISGMSSNKMAISEIGVTYPDSTFKGESRFGIPFIFLLRDIIQFDKTIDSSINRMISAKRTCNLILGVGDGKENEFRGFAYDAMTLDIFDDKNLLPDNSTWHPRIDNVVYWGMDWLCPAYSKRLSEEITKYHGNITPENTISNIVAMTTTGNLQVSVYDLTNNAMYVSYAKASYQSGAAYAYERQFTKLDMTSLFAVTSPEEDNTHRN